VSDVTTRAFAGGRYVVEREIARGGMATVFLAHDRELDRPVAVKVLDARLADDEDVAGRFRREALTAARLAHPNVVQVYDAGEEAGEPFIVMEVVEASRSPPSSPAPAGSRPSACATSACRRPRPSGTRTSTGSCTGT